MLCYEVLVSRVRDSRGVTNAERDRDRDRGALKTHTHRRLASRALARRLERWASPIAARGLATVENVQRNLYISRAKVLEARQYGRVLPGR